MGITLFNRILYCYRQLVKMNLQQTFFILSCFFAANYAELSSTTATTFPTTTTATTNTTLSPTTAGPPLKNVGEDCWSGCKGIQGQCSWCGTKGYCCKKGERGNGCDGYFGGNGHHICALKPERNNGGCCRYIQVTYDSVNNAYMNYKQFYTTYERQPGAVNGKPYYASVVRLVVPNGQAMYMQEGNYRISFCGLQWEIQEKEKQGTCQKKLYHPQSLSAKCVTDVTRSGWKYHNRMWSQEESAWNGLNVECIQE